MNGALVCKIHLPQTIRFQVEMHDRRDITRFFRGWQICCDIYFVQWLSMCSMVFSFFERLESIGCSRRWQGCDIAVHIQMRRFSSLFFVAASVVVVAAALQPHWPPLCQSLLLPLPKNCWINRTISHFAPARWWRRDTVVLASFTNQIQLKLFLSIFLDRLLVAKKRRWHLVSLQSYKLRFLIYRS